MKKLVIGILAHVDAGKTTLSESMLYLSGKIRQLGRVDNKDAYLDTYELEKNRGITIFSKQAVMEFEDLQLTLLDTPGHVDFSAEMERTLQVLDYAILVVSGADGIQGHTRTLWKLLEIHNIPTFVFVNKMDQKGMDRSVLLAEIKNGLSDNCIPFDEVNDDWDEQLALCDERVMESYLATGRISQEDKCDLVASRKAFPVYFGSALRQEGTKNLIVGLGLYSKTPQYTKEFGGKVYKITRDPQGNRLTHVKITGGGLRVKEVIEANGTSEKINQIRIYSGDKYKSLNQVDAGAVCALTGLNNTRPGQGIGFEHQEIQPLLEPVLSYHLVLPDGVDELQILPKLRELEEEEPTLRIVWNEVLKLISIQIMGAVQIEILQAIILDRYGVLVDFDEGRIVYKETIKARVEGVGHFEPLRHYSEVHLLLEPGKRGSGLVFASKCSEDILDKNWQRLVLTHLKEKNHIGVLTGSHITDMKITLVTGRGHIKHTAGGDFREATFRALRQGLKEADSILLEPYFSFRLELPEHFVGRAMTDIDKMFGQSQIEFADGERTILIGSAPVSTMRNYQQEVNTYTRGYGKLSTSVKGYDLCHNTEKIVEAMNYDSERDLGNPTGSVFCSRGAGFLVEWDQVKSHMHVESYLKAKKELVTNHGQNMPRSLGQENISLEEIDAIINRSYNANQGKKKKWKNKKSAKESYYESVTSTSTTRINATGEEYLLVDGYNIIFDWPELKDIGQENLEYARTKLMNTLSNYQGVRKCHIILVFDAYRVEGRSESIEDYHNIHVVYTGEAQTADQYIEKFAHENQKKYRITVATSDGMQQIIIRGAGANLLSARELRNDILDMEEELQQTYLDKLPEKGASLEDVLSEADLEKLRANKN